MVLLNWQFDDKKYIHFKILVGDNGISSQDYLPDTMQNLPSLCRENRMNIGGLSHICTVHWVSQNIKNMLQNNSHTQEKPV